ncbi:MAG: hypothetical protein ABL963_00990 [Longimicrobiales bacterium]
MPLARPRLGLSVLLTALAACARGPAPGETSGQTTTGEQLFTQETFGGNGRTCATCHDLAAFGTLTPERVQALFEVDATAPIFRTLDGDDDLGATYERLRAHATIRVSIALDPDPATGLAVRRCDAPLETSVVLHRGVPSMFNASLDGNLMADGREGADLETQARNAIATHAEPRRTPTADELAAIADFERSLFTNDAILRSFRQGDVLRPPPGITESEIRGRTFLDPDRACGLCHSGPLLNRTSGRHPNTISFDFASSLVGQEPDNTNPKHDWCLVDVGNGMVAGEPSAAERTFAQPTADPGAVALPGFKVYVTADERLDTIRNAQLPALVGGPPFKIPMLWGIANTAPYFHDNSAKTLEDVVDQYNFVFERIPELAAAAACDPTRPQCFDEQDKADIVAYLRLLTFDSLGVRAPGGAFGGP